MPIEDIIIRIRAEFAGFAKAMGNSIYRLNELITISGKLDKRFKENQTIMGRFATRTRLMTHGLGADFKDFMKVIEMPLDKFREMNKVNRTIVGTGAKLANRFRLMTHGLRGFRMEMLSVMFFGLGMERFFAGLLQPALDLVGVFDLWNLTLAIGFLPTALQVNDVMLAIMNIFLGLPEPVQQFIGTSILLGEILGKLLFLFGALTLGLSGLIQGWVTFTTVVLPFLGWLALISAGIIGLIILWKNWNSISASTKIIIAGLLIVLASLLMFISPLAAGIVIIGVVIIGLMAIIKNWGNITDWLKTKWQNFADWWINLINKLIGIWNKFAMSKIGKMIGLEPIEYAITYTYADAIMRARQSAIASNDLNFNPIINVTTTGGIDIEKIKYELNQSWSEQLAQLARR